MDSALVLDDLLGIEDGESPMRHRTAVVSSLGTDGTAVILLGTGSIVARVLAGVVVSVGDSVQVAVWQGDLLVLGRTRPVVKHDAATESATFTTTTPHTFTHTPNGTPRGVLVFIDHGTPSTDVITSVTYGGVAMTRVASAADAAGEDGRVYAYFLGKGIPVGAQTVSIVHSGSATVKHAVAVTTTAPGDCAAYYGGILTADQANPQIAVNTTTAVGLRYDAIYSGAQSVSDLTPLTGMTAVHDHDFGNFVSRVDRQTTASSGSFTIGYTAASDDVAMLAVAVICPLVSFGKTVCIITRGAAQTIGAQAAISFDGVATVDTLGMFSPITPDRLTPTVPGRYDVTFSSGFASSVAGTFRFARIYKNGTAVFDSTGGFRLTPLAGVQYISSAPTAVLMNGTTDYLEARVLQDTGGNLDTIAAGSLGESALRLTYKETG